MKYKKPFIAGIITSLVVGFFYLQIPEPQVEEALGAPSTEVTYQKNLIPLTDSTYTIGTTTKAWLNGFFDELCLAGDCKTAWPTGGAGGGSGTISTSSPLIAGELLFATGVSTTASVATGTLTENATGLEFSATRGLVGGASILSLTSGYVVPTTTRANLWDGKQDTITAGDALTLTGTDIDFDGGATPSGDLGNTWASPSVNDDSHAHTGTTLSGIDISSDTNLTVTATGLELSLDAIALTSGYTIPTTTRANTWDTAFSWGNHALAGYLTTVDISANTNLTADGTEIILAGDALSLGTVLTFTTGTSSTSFQTPLLGIGSDYISDITGSGLTLTNGVLNVTSSGGDGVSNWTFSGTNLTPSTTPVGITVNGTSTLATTTFTGEVGIGTTNPYNKLHVMESAVSGSDANADDLFVLEKDGDVNANFIGSDTGTVGFLFSDSTRGVGQVKYNLNTNNMFFISSGGGYAFGEDYWSASPGTNNVVIQGKVGIGSTTPSRMLTVAGDAIMANLTATGTVTFSGLTSNGFVKTSGGTGALSIDTSTYLTTVDVSANTNLTADGTEIVLTGDALSLGTNLTFTNATSTTFSTDSLRVTGSGTSTIITGNVQVDGDLEVTGNVGGTGMLALITAMISAALVTFASAVVTFTNKRITQRVVTTTDDATAVIDVDATDVYELSAVANATTFTLTGTPTDGQKLFVRFKDAGVAKGLTWTGFTAIGITLPTTTVVSKWGYVGCVYNSAATQWQAIAYNVEA